MIGTRPAPLLPQNGLLASTACTFSTTCVFAYVCSFRRCVVIRVRPAPSFDQHGLLASTMRTFLRRLIFIMFGRFQKNCAPLKREAHFGPSGSPAPKGTREALQGGGLGRLGLSLGSLRAKESKQRPTTTWAGTSLFKGRKCTSGRHGTKKNTKTKNGHQFPPFRG